MGDSDIRANLYAINSDILYYIDFEKEYVVTIDCSDIDYKNNDDISEILSQIEYIRGLEFIKKY